MVDRDTPEQGRVGMNVSLTSELARLVNERVRSGLYGTSSEVVRESLRQYFARDPDPATSGKAPEPSAPELSTDDWAELRAALLAGESLLVDERSATIAQLFAAGIALARARFAASGAAPEVVEKRLAQWLRERAGGGQGDGPGVPVTPERIARILGD